MFNQSALASGSFQTAAQAAADYFRQGTAMQEQKQYQAALECFQTACRLQPDYAEAWWKQGNVLQTFKQYQAAVDSYEQAIALKPDYAEAYSNRGIALQKLRLYEAALASFKQAIALKPDYANAYNNCGLAYKDIGQFTEELECYAQAIALKPDFAEAYYNHGNALQNLQRHEAALASYQQAISLRPDHVNAYFNHGNALLGLKRYAAALLSFERVIALKPDAVDAYINSGFVHKELKRFNLALACFEQIITLWPDFAPAYNNCGLALHELNQPQAALERFAQAIALQPDYAEAYNNLGLVLNALQRYHAALQNFERAIALKPDFADAYYHHGLALYQLGQYQDASLSFTQAMSLDAGLDYLPGHYLQTKLYLCDWKGIESEFTELATKILSGMKAAPPQSVLAMFDSSAMQQTVAEVWTRDKNPGNGGMAESAKYPRHAKPRVGYFSADFHNHPVAILTAELFEIHDRSRFEIMAFSLSEPETKDQLRIRLEAGFDRFIEVQNLSDEEVVKLARELEIDIAVDLGGHTGKCRTGIFALRAAPLQVSYLGFAGTMGADYMDYLIADKIVIPPASRRYYTEKIAYLPHSFFVHDSTRRISDGPVNRAQFGLPETGFVFCCFNNTYKLNPATFIIWMRILTVVENSVLWLFEGNPTAGANLKQAAGQSGVDPDRLIFAERLPQIEEHLARQALADLFLDTLPYNAHTTACDALWAGLPVLTCLGESFAGRVAASQLSAIGLPELIAETPAQYEALAIELATNAEKLAGVKARLAQNRLTTPLFDTRLFTGHLQAAYTQMYERYQADLACEHIFVDAEIG